MFTKSELMVVMILVLLGHLLKRVEVEERESRCRESDFVLSQFVHIYILHIVWILIISADVQNRKSRT